MQADVTALTYTMDDDRTSIFSDTAVATQTFNNLKTI